LALDSVAGASWPIDPRGSGARSIANLWWLMVALSAIVIVIVLTLVALAVLHSPEDREPPAGGMKADSRFVVAGGIAFPIVILSIVFGYTLYTAQSLAEEDDAAFSIVVEGNQFWWAVSYPDHGIVTANEIHIPVDVPVDLQLITSDVIHSFWVPQLHGKLDMIPGQTNTLRLVAESSGEYRGQCAEFCGIQHANMALLVIAQEQGEFDTWVANQQQDAVVADNDLVKRGEQVFLGAACVYCHTVRGTNATGEVGPDLTHLASRRTLASGILENNRGNLAGWILDPQSIKPGSLMPGSDINAADVQALLAYLESLE
jgi:cytochrome c oxidase subunit II